MTQTKPPWEVTGFSSALQVFPSLRKLFSMRAGEVEVSSLLVHAQPQHDQWVVLAQLSWITGIPDEAAMGCSSASAQLHPAVVMGVVFWLSEVQGMCFMALKHICIVLMTRIRNLIVFSLGDLETEELNSVIIS